MLLISSLSDQDGKQFKGKGDLPEDYFCFNKPVLAPADGYIESVVDDIEDNIIGKPNIKENWGNTVIIRHNNYLYLIFEPSEERFDYC